MTNIFPSIDDLHSGKSGTKKTQLYIHNHYPEFEQHVLNNCGSWTDNWIEKLYCYFYNITEQPLCIECKKPTKFHGFNYGYSQFCSVKCSRKSDDVKEKARQTCIRKYGVDNPRKLDKVKEKAKQTCIKKYGGPAPMSSKDVQRKTRQTNMERYGGPAPISSKDVQRKTRQTNMERYGGPAPISSKDVQDRIRQTNIERYGGIGFASEILKEKQQLTMKERYGVSRNMHDQKCIDKIRKTCFERYGVEFAVLSHNVRNCMNNDSNPNMFFANLLDVHNIDYVREYALNRYVYDFKIGNTLIEINPFPTHNSTWGPFNNPKDKYYHYNKTRTSIENGYSCMHIWDWDDLDKIVNILSPKTVIYARKCIVSEIDSNSCNKFLKEYHIQSDCKGQSICIGLFYEDELVGVMTFGKPRYNKKYEYELLRLCYSKYMVVGGSEKLFNYFIKTYQPNSIITYCDNSKFDGDVYKRLNFSLLKSQIPSKHWYNGKTKQHITNNLLLQRGFDQLFKTSYGKGASNEQLMLEHGFVEIYDCGQSTYIYEKPSSGIS